MVGRTGNVTVHSAGERRPTPAGTTSVFSVGVNEPRQLVWHGAASRDAGSALPRGVRPSHTCGREIEAFPAFLVHSTTRLYPIRNPLLSLTELQPQGCYRITIPQL